MSLPRKSRPSQSPLDALGKDAQAKLEARVNSRMSYAEINAWLKREFKIKVSDKALSDWRQRRFKAQLAAPRPQGAECPTRSVCHGAFEITVTAPGAAEIRVTVRPTPLSQA